MGKNNTRDTSGELRGLFDGRHDSFMTGGHQLIILRKSSRKTPLWVHDYQKIKDMLLKAFPKLETNQNHRMRASRWARVIQLYFRTHFSYTEVAEELGVSRDLVKAMVRNIRRGAAGRRTDGGEPTGRPNGRPRKAKKPVATLGTSNESTPRTR